MNPQSSVDGSEPPGLEFVIISPEYRQSVIHHLRENFFADEPLNKAVGLCRRGEPHEKLERLCCATMTDGLSIAAVQNNQTVCIMECRIVSVGAEMRGRGLARNLISRSLDLAKRRGFKVFKVDATGAYSQRICHSLSMREARRVYYDKYRDEAGRQVFTVPPPHDCLSIMIAELG